MPCENNGFHEMVIIDHPELEILYESSFKASKCSEMECVPLYSIHFATHFQFNESFPRTYSVPGIVLSLRNKKMKAVFVEIPLLLRRWT